MPTPSRQAGQRGLTIVIAALVLTLVVVDLFRPDSLLLSLWADVFGTRSHLRDFMDGMRDRDPGRIFRR